MQITILDDIKLQSLFTAIYSMEDVADCSLNIKYKRRMKQLMSKLKKKNIQK